MRLLLSFLSLPFLLAAQVTIYDPLGSSLSTYLDLTPAQITTVADLNRQFADTERTRSRRQSQLRFEIADETARTTMDVSALGLRYRELELLRRESAAQLDRTREQLQALLTAPQKAKLATLQQALQLRDTACEAINQNLLVLPPVVLGVPPGASQEYITFLLGPATAGPCPASLPLSTSLPRAGDTIRKSESVR